MIALNGLDKTIDMKHTKVSKHQYLLSLILRLAAAEFELLFEIFFYIFFFFSYKKKNFFLKKTNSDVSKVFPFTEFERFSTVFSNFKKYNFHS